MESRVNRKRKNKNKLIIAAAIIYSIVLMAGVYAGYTIKDTSCKQLHTENK